MSPETEQIIREARHSLAGAGVWKMFLFGSRSDGRDGGDSDVDLVVVLDREEPFHTFSERSAVLIDLHKRLSEISDRHGLDLLLFTRSEWKRFIEKGSWFSKEIQREALEVA